jgi:hypothetical protein
MSSRICVALSLLTILTFLADETPSSAQKGTLSWPSAVPARLGERERAKPIVVAELVEQLRTADVEERGKIIQQLSDTEQNIVPALVRATTILGQIGRDTAVAWQNGSLSAKQRQQAIAELTKVLNIMQAPNARFNREPIDRVRNALTTLRGVTP